MSRFTLPRRALLRGAAGAALALPPLEIMAPRRGSAAAAIPNRFCMAFSGMSVGGNNATIDTGGVVPRKTGRNFELGRPLLSVAGDTVCKGTAQQESFAGITGDLGIVSGLSIPASIDPPYDPAGRGNSFHGQSVLPQTAGQIAWTSTCQGERYGSALATTADQIVAKAFGGATRIDSLYLRVQASPYSTIISRDGCWNLAFKDGDSIDPIADPRLAYNTLFGSGLPAGEATPAVSLLDRRKSVLDAVMEKSRRLLPRLGVGDRVRLDKYYEQVRALETSLEGLKTTSRLDACRTPAVPPDVKTSDGLPPVVQAEPDSPDVSWSNEELRAKIMADLLYVALACDVTRSAIYQLTVFECCMNAYHILSSPRNLICHTLTHYGNPDEMGDMIGWHVKHFSRLVSMLKETLEIDGSRLLDHCALSLLLEGGHGPVLGADPSAIWSSHSTDNMIVAVAGGVGGLQSGQHIHFNNDRHPGQVVLTHMNAVLGTKRPLGALTEPLPELFKIP